MCGILARRERASADGLTILTYHRVLPDERCAAYPFPSLAMPISLFREQLRWLAEQGDVVRLAEVLEQGEEDGSPSRGARPRFALTFDDGYRDAAVAAELLDEFGMRGTFFVTTGFVGSRSLLWFDEAVLLFTEVDEAARREIVREVRGVDLDLPPPGSSAATWAASLKSCPVRERLAILAELGSALGGSPPVEGFEALSIAEVVDLDRNGHELGSHTVTHAVLTALDDAGLEGEVEASRTTLAAWLGTGVAGFCYPNGDWDERVAAAVDRAGHLYACTTRGGVHRHGDDPFRIPRVDVVADRVTNTSRRFDPTAFRRELCRLYAHR